MRKKIDLLIFKTIQELSEFKKKIKKKILLLLQNGKMSNVPNIFNNFQVRPPLLKNPINRAPPVQLTRSRPGVVTYTAGGNNSIDVSQVAGQSIHMNIPTANTVGVFNLPPASALLRELGTQNSGLQNPTWSVATSSGDCLFLQVVNRSNNTGAIAADSAGSTGTVLLAPATGGAYSQGSMKTVTVQFTNVTTSANGVTGAYIVY